MKKGCGELTKAVQVGVATASRGFLWSVLASTFCQVAQAEVLDVTGGEYSTVQRSYGPLVSGVLDLERPRQPLPEAEEETPPPRAVSLPVPNTGRRGSPQIEGLIQEIALHYSQHRGIRAADLSTTEWVALFRANIAIESNFRQSARSHVGAIGLGQLMPETARRLGVDPNDARQNLHGSARYLLMQLERFGSKELALAAYNAGPEAVTRHGGIPPYRETQGHVRKVLAIFHQTTGQETT